MRPIFEKIDLGQVTPDQLDSLLSAGWRHFGTEFFRQNFAIHDRKLCGILPLRLPLSDFTPTKSQRRILRKNADLQVRFRPSVITPELDFLFALHRERFESDAPDALTDFLSHTPACVPCKNQTVEVRDQDRLVAASFMDVAHHSVSSVYGLFDPAYSPRSPGIFTLLLEMEWAKAHGKQFHYSGYSYTTPSPYDYKKRFPGVEAYDWGFGWIPLPSEYTWTRDLSSIAE